MEARRLERQRRDSAKSSAVQTLPSTQDHDFNIRLIDLYGQHECLWNTALSEHSDVELKRQAWDEIAKKLGAHLTASFVRCRINSLRYRLNLYKLQMIEYKMGPSSAKQPEKLYYIDHFAFLERIHQQQEEEPASDSEKKSDSDLSIASIFKQRLQQQQQQHQHEHLPHVLRRLTAASEESDVGVASVVQRRLQKSAQPSLIHMPKFQRSLLSARQLLQKARLEKLRNTSGSNIETAEKPVARERNANVNVDSMLQERMHRLNLIERGRKTPPDSLDSVSNFQGSRLNIPSVVQKRMRAQLPLGMQLEKSSSKSFPNLQASQESLPHGTTTLRAQPGDSVSKTKLHKYRSRSKQRTDMDRHSDDEELYRLHWTVRQQKRTRRSAGAVTNHEFRSQPLPTMPLDTYPSSSMKFN
ncbi:hypothetical protein KR222_003281 [Zaprionus bogoriensis]|nr:hypothetical protein KR222_003281 [Zaprionus bogoriensis]